MLPIILSALFHAAAQPPVVQVSECDFGEVYPGKAAECLVEFSNPGDNAVRLHKISGMFGNKSDVENLEIPAHGTKQVRWLLDIDTQYGTVGHYLKFYIEGDERPHYGKSHGFVANIIEQNKPLLDLGAVDIAEATRVPSQIRFSSNDVPSFRMTKVLSAPDYLDIKIGDDRRSVDVAVKDGAPWGAHDDYVKIAIDAPQQPLLSFQVKSLVQGDVVASSNPFAFGLLRTGANNEIAIRLERRSGGSLALGKMTLAGIVGKVKESSCVPTAKNCRLVKLSISDNQPRLGKLSGELRVDLPQDKRVLPIQLWGALVKKEVVIRDLDKEFAAAAEKTKDAPADERQSPAVGGQKLTDVLRRVSRNSDTPPEGKGPLIRWQVAHETGLYGYNIYRADSADGPFKRVNADVVKVMSEDGSGAAYMWRDQSAVAGNTYWYYVATVAHSGEKKKLSDAAKVVAK